MDKEYKVKTDEFIDDYKFIKVDKEQALIKALSLLDQRVAERLEALKPEIIEEVKLEIEKEVNEEYDEKIAIYEKYLEEVIEEVVEQVSEEEISNENISEEVISENINPIEENQNI